MSGREQDQGSDGTENGTDDGSNGSAEETVGPELTQEDLDRAGEKMDGLNERYETGARETVTLPGTNGTVSGTAFADMVDGESARDESAEGGDTSQEEAAADEEGQPA
ncbi:hypothetical protein [Rhodococcoides corynebacterioides]|uniref:hypothetical protein n=1 Tax=Rhodococcoides corynebacterioides TaxID=53972 RepID=UPI0021BE2041|nr:hypothetical protein [Rhodococcus corynebacterioides]